MPIDEIINQFKIKLKEFAETDDHLFDCMAYSEGWYCCIDDHPKNKHHDKIINILKEVLENADRCK